MSQSHPVSWKWRRALASGAAALAVALMLGAPSGLAQANAVVLTGCGGGDFGADCSLGELITNSGSIEYGDKLFTGFANFSSQPIPDSIPPVDPATISVLPISMGGELGLEFTPTPSINTSSLSNLGATFRYFVLVTDAGLRISDNTLCGLVTRPEPPRHPRLATNLPARTARI